MKAIVIRQPGGSETLSYEEVPDPEPGPGEVLVRVRAAGVNHLDLFMSRGLAWDRAAHHSWRRCCRGGGGRRARSQRPTHEGAGHPLPGAHLWPVSLVFGRRGQFLPAVAAIGPGSERWVR